MRSNFMSFALISDTCFGIVWANGYTSGPLPQLVKCVLSGPEDNMQEDLSKKLPPRIAVWQNWVTRGHTLPSRASYLMWYVSSRVGGVKKAAIQSACMHSVLFQKKVNGSVRRCLGYQALTKVSIQTIPWLYNEQIALIIRAWNFPFFLKLDIH